MDDLTFKEDRFITRISDDLEVTGKVMGEISTTGVLINNLFTYLSYIS